MEKMSIKKNVFYNSIYTILNIVFPLITFPYASRCLLAEGMGKVAFYTAVSNYAMILGSLGISTYGIRKVAQEKENKENLTKTVSELFLLNMFFSICVFFVLLLLSFVVPKLRSDFNLLIINCIYILLAPLGLDWAYSGLEQYKYITLRSFVCKFISLVLLFIFVHDASDYVVYAMVIAFSGASAWIINFVHIRKFITKPYLSRKFEFKVHIKPMLLLFSSLLAVNIYTNVDTIMLGVIAGDKQVGYYTVATKVKTVMLALVNAISAVLLPRMSIFFRNGEYSLFKQTINKSISTIFCIAIPCTIFFEISAVEIINILGGPGYDDSIVCMQIMMPILLISGFSNITGNQILIPCGNEKIFMIAVVCGAIVNIFMNALLMPKYCAIGAAIATVVAEVVQMSVQTWGAKKYLKNNINYKYIFKIIAISIVIGLIISRIDICLDISNVYALFGIKCVGYFGGYVVFLILTQDAIIINFPNKKLIRINK